MESTKFPQDKFLPTVDILMATYNGQEYIIEQILSIISQTYGNWKLIIHDDGSTDSTLDIIYDFAKIDKRITVLEDNHKNLGAARNFIHLLEQSDSDLNIFCDQDDVWFLDKIQNLVQQINHFKNEPAAIYCNGYFYNDNNFETSTAVTSVKYLHKLSDALFMNAGIQGCSLMINKKLRQHMLPVPSFFYMHDHLITIFALTCCRLTYLDENLMLYRQHDSSVTESFQLSKMSRLIRFLRNTVVIDKQHFEANRALYVHYKSRIQPEKAQMFDEYFRYTKSSRLWRIVLILRNKFTVGGNIFPLIIKTILRKPI